MESDHVPLSYQESVLPMNYAPKYFDVNLFYQTHIRKALPAGRQGSTRPPSLRSGVCGQARCQAKPDRPLVETTHPNIKELSNYPIIRSTNQLIPWRCVPESDRRIAVLQTAALPLRQRTINKLPYCIISL